MIVGNMGIDLAVLSTLCCGMTTCILRFGSFFPQDLSQVLYALHDGGENGEYTDTVTIS